MGVDIIFNADFPTPKPAAVRLGELWTAFSRRPEFSEPMNLRVFELTDSANPIAVVQGIASDANVRAAMTTLLTEYRADKYSVRANWGIQGARDGRSTSYGVSVTARSPLTRRDSGFDRDIDVTWDVGDSRRYTPEGRDNYPTVEQVISDLRGLIECGPGSVWAAGPDRAVNPLALYAVYHRDLNDYGRDGVERPFPKWAIDQVHIELADEYARNAEGNQRILSTDVGPIVYSPLLVRGTLNMFYTYLDRVLKADIEDLIERTSAANYKAYECSGDQAEKWIVIERRTDGAQILRVDSLRQDDDILTIVYQLIEPGFNDRLAMTLIPLSVLQGLYGNVHRGSIKKLRYQNAATGTDDLVPYLA